MTVLVPWSGIAESCTVGGLAICDTPERGVEAGACNRSAGGRGKSEGVWVVGVKSTWVRSWVAESLWRGMGTRD